MRNLAILYLFLPLIAFGMDHSAEDPVDSKSFPLPISSAKALSDVRTEMRVEPINPEVLSGVPADRQKGKRPSRIRIKTSAVKYGGPLDLDALRVKTKPEEDFTSLLPVAAPLPTDEIDSLARTQQSTTEVSSGVVMPYKRKDKARDPKDHPSSGIILPPKWRAELTKQ